MCCGVSCVCVCLYSVCHNVCMHMVCVWSVHVVFECPCVLWSVLWYGMFWCDVRSLLCNAVLCCSVMLCYVVPLHNVMCCVVV